MRLYDALLERERINALWHIDHNGVAGTGRLIVLRQFGAQASHLDPDPGVGLWVKTRRSTEDLRRDFILLQVVRRGVQRVVGQELKELAKSL
jgi:hypothetical protein